MLKKRAISLRQNKIVRTAGIMSLLGESSHLSGFADDIVRMLQMGGEGVEAGTAMFNRSDDLLKVINKEPAKFIETFKSLGPEQQSAIKSVWETLPAAQKEGKTLEEFAASKMAKATGVGAAGNVKLKIDGFVDAAKKNPADWLSQYNKASQAQKDSVNTLWKEHPESKNFSTIEDYVKSLISDGSAAVPEAAKGAIESIDDSLVIFSKGDEVAAVKEYERLRGLARGEGTPVTPEEMEKIIKAIDSNQNLNPEAASSLKESIRKKTMITETMPSAVSEAANVVPEAANVVPEAAATGTKVARTSEEILDMVKKANNIDEVAVIVSSNKAQITDDIAKRMLDIYKSNPDKYLVDYNKLDDSIKTIMADLPKTKGAEATLNKITDLVKAKVEVDLSLARAALSGTKPISGVRPISGAAAVGESADTAAAVAAKSTNARKIGRYVAGAALGLTGIALINYMMSDDKEEGGGLSQSGGAPPITGDSSSPEAGRLDYEGASKIMMDKGYLDSIQNDWTPEFGAAFREFIDAGTANNSAVTPTNLVGGQKWADVAPGLGFSPDRGGALNAIVAIGKSAPSKRGGPNSPPITGGGRVPEDTGGGRGAKSAKREVLADIISRLYNNRLVEGGGGIFSNELKQTQSLVDAIGGAGPGGYLNAADVLLARNPQLENMLPSTKITDVLTRNNIKSHPAYQAAYNTQKTIHDVFKAANKGKRILGINRGQKATTENVAEYLASPAGGGWKQPTTASNSVDRFVKLAEDRKARIKVEVLASLTPAERAIVRKNKMREI